MTQTQAVLRYLQAHGSITPLEALQELGCFRLAARVWDLNKEGHLITCRWENRGGKRYARYVLAEAPGQIELFA